MNEITALCASCGHQTDCSLSLAGKEIECEGCKCTTKVPRSPMNPFARPIIGIIEQLKEIQWQVPFLAQSIQAAVLCLVLFLIGALAVTVGVAFQIGGVFKVLLIDASTKAKTGGFVERSAYAISAGVYLLLYVPFWMIQFPFALIGWIWTLSRAVALVVGLSVVAILLVVVFEPSLARSMLDALVVPVRGLVRSF